MKKEKKISKVMREFKSGKLKSGKSKKKVVNKKAKVTQKRKMNSSTENDA